MNNESVDSNKKLKGFAAMTPERQREIASMGGRAAQASGNAYHWNSETAKAASDKAKIRKEFYVSHNGNKEDAPT